MFRVLTSRRKSPLTSPRFIVGSVVAHLWVALVVATVSRAETPTELTEVITELPVLPRDPAPAKPPVEPVRTDRPVPTRGPNVQLQAPTTVPNTIAPEDPKAVPQQPDTGLGIGADLPGPANGVRTEPTGNPDPTAHDENWVYSPEMVEERPTLNNAGETGRLLERYYPPVYAEAGVAGRTVVELIVEANGRVRPGSVRVVESSHEQFADAALRVAERMRFRPAKIGDQAVAVIVQVPIDWRAAR
jgi:periplasmic protein TonB